MKNKIFIKLFLLISNITYVFSDCEISQEAADKCGMKSVLFGNREADMPTNEGELDGFCVQMRTNNKCVQDFSTKCLTGRIQMAINIALNNGRKFVDKRCNNAKDRQDFITHVKCLHPKEKMKPFHLCADKHLVMLTKLKEIPKADRIPALCCTGHISQECLRNQFKANCGEETTNYWDDAWDELTSENMEFVCSEFPDVAACDKKMNPPSLAAIKSVANSDDETVLAARHKFKSEITTAMELMDFLSD